MTPLEALGIIVFVTESTRALLEKALKLPEAERVTLAYEILESLEAQGEFSSDQIREIERRAKAALSGKSPPGDEWEVVVARLEKRLADRRAK